MVEDFQHPPLNKKPPRKSSGIPSEKSSVPLKYQGSNFLLDEQSFFIVFLYVFYYFSLFGTYIYSYRHKPVLTESDINTERQSVQFFIVSAQKPTHEVRSLNSFLAHFFPFLRNIPSNIPENGKPPKNGNFHNPPCIYVEPDQILQNQNKRCQMIFII